jgi:hypothetical protein
MLQVELEFRDAIVVEQECVQALEVWKVFQTSNLVVGQVDHFELVVGHTEVLNVTDLET